MTDVVQFSTGVSSYLTARRVRDQGRQPVLLFADVRPGPDSPFYGNPHQGEDEDNYRFARDAAAALDAPLVTVTSGLGVWDIARDENVILNTRIAPCSRRLKHEPAREWVEANCDPADATLYVGISWDEQHRCGGISAGWAPYRVEFPMTRKPYLLKPDMLAVCREDGIDPPRMYGHGFAHANCGGACVKAGRAQWVRLYRVWPDRFAFHERQEQHMRDLLGGDFAILRDRRDVNGDGGAVKAYTLRQLREDVEAADRQQPGLFDEAVKFDEGGCACGPFDDPHESAAVVA